MTKLAQLTLTLALLAQPAGAVDVLISADLPGCSDVSSATLGCPTGGAAQLTVTWALDAETALNGYDLEIAWDPDELTLVAATPLYADTEPAPVPFWHVPSDPNDSHASALSLTAFSTTGLFSLTFDVSADAPDGLPDVTWAAAGDGLSPGSVSLENPAGAGIDFTATACSNGLDDDGDGGIDMGDAGCGGPNQANEAPQCQDGLDNDGDGLVDFDGGASALGSPIASADDYCAQPWYEQERASRRRCGLGFEAALALPVLMALRRRRRCAS